MENLRKELSISSNRRLRRAEGLFANEAFYMKPCIALLGCGKWGRNYARILKDMDVLDAIITSRETTTQQYSDIYNTTPRTWQDICSDSNIQAVVIATPPETHESLAVEALSAKKHVLVEKPFAISARGARFVRDVSLKTSRHLMVGHLMLHHKAFITLLQCIQSGKIGTIRKISSYRTSLQPTVSPLETLWSLAPHDLSMILSLPVSHPVNLKTVLNNGIDINLMFEGGVEANIHLSKVLGQKKRVFHLEGDKGMLTFDDMEDWPNKLQYSSADTGEIHSIDIKPIAPLTLQCLHFLDMIQSDNIDPNQGNTGLKIAELMENIAKKLALPTKY